MPVPSIYRTSAFGPIITTTPANIYRTNAFGPAIPERLVSGGYALWANGSGAASFDSFRVTQYPDPSVSLLNAGRAINSLVNWNGTFPPNTSVQVQTSNDNGITWQTNTGAGAPVAGISTQLFSTLALQKLPTAYYRLDDTGTTAADLSGNGYTGTLHGTITPGAAGALQGPGESSDMAMTGDGTSGYISLFSSLTTNGLSALSFCFWLNLSNNSFSGARCVCANDTPGSSNHGFLCNINAGGAGVKFAVGNGASSANINYASTTFAAGTWYLVGCTWDGSTLKIYIPQVNGSTPVGTAPLSGSFGTTSNPIYLFHNPTGGSDYLPGSLDEVLFFSTVPTTVLSGSDFVALYNAGLCGLGKIANDSFTTNTSSSYTQTFGNGGAAAVWTWDTANSRVQAVGGTKAHLLYNALWSYDTDILADFYQAENGGLIWGYQDNKDYYSLVLSDSAASTPNIITINKISAGTLTQLATASIAFPTQTHHRVHLTMLSGMITVYFDENQVLSYTDSAPFSAGLAGLRNDTGTSYCYLLQITPQPVSVANQYLCVRQTLTTTDPTVTPQITDYQAMASDSTFGTGALVPSVDYRQTYVSDNLDDLNVKSNYWWQVGDTAVTFQARDAKDAPYILQSTDILINSLPSVEYSGDMYRNKQVLKGVFQTSIFSQQFVGDGTSKTWNVANPIEGVPTILLNGQAQSVGIQGTDTGKNFYYQLNSTAITQDNSGTTLRKDIDVLTVSYLGAYGIDFEIDNTGQFSNTIDQAQYADNDGTSGIVEALEDVSGNGGMNLDAATDYANQLLARYGSIARTITFQTLHSGLKIGHSLPIFIPELNIFDSVFLVVEISISVRSVQGGIQYVYAVIASEAAALSSWVKYFSKVMRSIKGTKAKA